MIGKLCPFLCKAKGPVQQGCPMSFLRLHFSDRVHLPARPDPELSVSYF